MQPLKLVVVGPVRSGKTTIANFLADATEMPYDYHPTQGVRILEFELQNIEVNNRQISKDIELWDCSGDHKFEHCWPAMKRDIQGVIIVYTPKSQDCLKDVEVFYDYFVNQTKLGPEKCVIFCFDPEKKNPDIVKSVSSTFASVSHVRCNVDDGGNKLKADFSSFISSLITKIDDPLNQEETLIMSSNILFEK